MRTKMSSPTPRRGLCLALGLVLALLGPAQAAQIIPQPPPQTNVPPAPPPSSSAPQGSDDHGGGRNWTVPALIVGAAALFAIGRTLAEEKTEQRDEDEGTRALLRDGPQLAAQYNGSAFGVRGLVRGGWPVVVDYAQHRPGQVLLRIALPGAETVSYRLDKFGLGRHLLRFDLPPFLGDRLKPAVIALTAADPDTGRETIDGFSVHGLGIGPRAVGSVAVDRLEFDPGMMHPARGETAGYAFHTRSDFDHAAVEFMQVSQSPDGMRKRYVKGQRIGPVARDRRVESAPAQRWYGRDEHARLSAGRHQLQVRVWDEGGDWVGAWSESIVLVQ